MFKDSEREVVMQQSVFTRYGADRMLKFAFDLARKRKHGHVSAATKSNALGISMRWWDKRIVQVAQAYPDVPWDSQHIDALCARFVLQPQQLDVVVATNLFGDILSDLGPACAGTIGIAPSANLNPERRYPSLFEPVHGSAPDIYGKGIANPVGMIWSGALMLDFIGGGCGPAHDAHDAIIAAIEEVLIRVPRMPDMGGDATTRQMGEAIATQVAEGFKNAH